MKVFTYTIDLASKSEIWYYLAYSDPHWGSIQCDEQHYLRTLGKFNKYKNVHYLSLGDELNSILLKGDKRGETADVVPRMLVHPEDPTRFRNDLLGGQLEDYNRSVMPLIPEERDMGHTSGNHPAKIGRVTGTIDVTPMMCKMANRRHLGWAWRYRVAIKANGKFRLNHNLYGHHGFGGGSKVDTGDRAKYIRHSRAQRDADLCLYAHTHKRWYVEQPRFRVTQRGKAELLEDSKYIVCTGGFLKVYSTTTTPGYAERGGFEPLPIGCWLIGNKITNHPNKSEKILSWFIPSGTPVEAIGGLRK